MSDESYTLGYGTGSVGLMAMRTAKSHAGFFLSELESGMRVLDIGCGPGTITFGLARKVHPAEVIGVELSLEQTEAVSAIANSKNLNLKFEEANAYSLPYREESFDAVFMSAVIGNLKRPGDALSEVFRVLRKSALVGIKEFDHQANITHPPMEFSKVDELHNRLRIHNGHDPDSGRKVRGYLNAAGFERVKTTATFQNIVAPEGTRGAPLKEGIIREEWGPEFVDLGWATQADIDRWIAQSQEYTPGTDYFCALAWIEALGYRPA